MSEAVNATALRPGDATIELKIRANYSRYYGAAEYVTIAKVTVIDPLLTFIPTYVANPY